LPVPDFKADGDLPPGVHAATLDEVVARFGQGSPQREAVTRRLLRIYQLASGTGMLQRFVIFGSYVTSKVDPNDIDIVLVMREDFIIEQCDAETRRLFTHQRAAEEFGASLFWVRPPILFGQPVDEFIAHWQIKRDKNLRGIVEVIA
jgi:hypothetical protein